MNKGNVPLIAQIYEVLKTRKAFAFYLNAIKLAHMTVHEWQSELQHYAFDAIKSARAAQVQRMPIEKATKLHRECERP